MDLLTLKHYFITTFLLVCLCLLFSLALAALIYESAKMDSPQKPNNEQLPQLSTWLPSLVITPMIIIGLYRAFHWHAVIPVSEDLGSATLVAYSLLPALILVFASGLASTIMRETKSEMLFWQSKTFTRLLLANGLSVKKYLRKLVYLRAMSISWSNCLPWLFCELLVIEALFNAPGLGMDLWTSAKLRDSASFIASATLLLVIYLMIHSLNLVLSQWLGKKLESYH